MKKLLFIILVPVFLLLPCRAADAAVQDANSEIFDQAEILKDCTVLKNGAAMPRDAEMSGYFTERSFRAGDTVTAESECPIAGVILRFRPTSPDAVLPEWTLEADGKTLTGGNGEFIHQYLGGFSANSITLTFTEAAPRCSICFLSEGELPDWVQVWDAPWDRADVLLLPTHSDDDQLFFAGLIPWAIDRGARVQVAYLVHHYDDAQRMEELLDGLWTAGLRHYPVMGAYPDLGNVNYQNYLAYSKKVGIEWSDYENYQVTLLRRFKPQVAVTHSTTGEYGHGAHITNAYTMLSAVQFSADETAYRDSADEYGVWQVPKLYVHNAAEKQVVLDVDAPLSSFGGKTGYQIAQDAFRCHKSQLRWYSWYIYTYATAAEIPKYNPREFGLAWTTVGDDTNTDTLFDNIVLYDEQERIAAEQREAEARRIAEETAERLRLEAEEAERLAREEAERLAQAEADALAAAQRRKSLLFISIPITVLIVVCLVIVTRLSISDKKKG